MTSCRDLAARSLVCSVLLAACNEPTPADVQKVDTASPSEQPDASTAEPNTGASPGEQLDDSTAEPNTDASPGEQLDASPREQPDASTAEPELDASAEDQTDASPGDQDADASPGDQKGDVSFGGKWADAGDCPPPNSDVQIGNAYGEVTAVESSGLWIFTYEERNGEESLVGGTAGMRCGCLTVSDAVVIWDETWLEFVEDLAARVRAGEAPQVNAGGGGGISLVPAVVYERCGVDGVIYQNTDQ